MIELVIVVSSVAILIFFMYSFFATSLDASATMLAERHKSDRMLFVCSFLPRIYIEGINRTVGEVISAVISTGDYMIYYGRNSPPVNATLLVSQILDQYLDKGYWQLKISDDMSIGGKVPLWEDVDSCSMTIPLQSYKERIANIYLYRW